MTNNFESEERDQTKMEIFENAQRDYVIHKLEVLHNDMVTQNTSTYDEMIKVHLLKALFYIDFDLQQLIKIMGENK